MQEYQPIGKLTHPTLVYTVAAVHISYPSMKEDAVKIHKELIKDYPQYDEIMIEVERFSPSDFSARPNTAVIPQYALSNPDRTTGIILTSERILFQTTHYQGFPDFSEKLKSILSIVKNITGLGHYSGLAFRHIDNIKPLNPENKMKDAIRPEFLTPSIFENPANSQISRHEYIYKVDKRNIIFRLYNFDTDKGPEAPMDIFANYFALKGRQSEKQIDPPYLLADFESHYLHPNDLQIFNIDKMIEEMDLLHKYASHTFRKIITQSELDVRR